MKCHLMKLKKTLNHGGQQWMMHSEHMSRIITHMELYRYFYLNLSIFEHVELNLCTICLVVITRGTKGICNSPYYFFFCPISQNTPTNQSSFFNGRRKGDIMNFFYCQCSSKKNSATSKYRKKASINKNILFHFFISKLSLMFSERIRWLIFQVIMKKY